MADVVVDASAIVELLLRTPGGLRAAVELREASVSAPAHLDAEVLSALGRLVRDGSVTERAVTAALTELARAPIRRFPLAPILLESWELRKNLALRDALYVALTRRLQARLLTADSRIARAPGLDVTVSVVTD